MGVGGKQGNTPENRISSDDIKTICPICSQEVRRVREVEHEIKRVHVKCENEFYIHWHDMLYKILNPNTLWS